MSLCKSQAKEWHYCTVAKYHGLICLVHKGNELKGFAVSILPWQQHWILLWIILRNSRGVQHFPSLLGLSYRKAMLSATWPLNSSKQSEARLGQSRLSWINQCVCRVLVIEPTPSQVSNSLGRFTCTPPSFRKRQGDGSKTTNVVLIIQH